MHAGFDCGLAIFAILQRHGAKRQDGVWLTPFRLERMPPVTTSAIIRPGSSHAQIQLPSSTRSVCPGSAAA